MDFELLNSNLPSYFSAFCSPGSNGADSICRDTWTLRDTKISRLHFHSCIEIAYCVQGTGTFYLDKRVYNYEPGDVQVVFPYQPHYSIADENCQCVWNYLYIEPYKLSLQTNAFDISFLRKMLSEEIKNFGLFKKVDHPDLYDIVMRLDKAISKPHRYRKELCVTILCELLLYMVDLKADSVLAVDKISKVNRKFIYRIIEIINQRVRDDGAKNMRVEELAQECNMSLSNFRKTFKIVTGFSPKEYITNVRLNYAEQLLLDTNHSIDTIADMAGFPTPASFYDRFAKVYGVTPKKYRDAAL